MAKGTLHLNVELSAVADEEGKFGRLATLLGLADADHARGKCEHLWVACTRRGEADLPQWLVEQVLGERGAAALVEAELATWAAGRGDSSCRRLRIGGAAKHCLWMSSSKLQLRHEQRSKGGETRAKTSSRQLDGTFAPRPAEHPAQSSSSEISSASEISDPESLPPARDPAVPEPEPTAPPPGPAVPAVSPPPAIRENIARTQPVGDRDPKPSNAVLPRGEAPMIWRELEQARAEAGVELGIHVLPLPLGDRGERDLADLFAAARERGPAEVETLVRQARHAIAMAKAETVSGEKLAEWFTGAVFGGNNFRRLVAKVARKPKPLRSADTEAKRRREAAADTASADSAPIAASAEDRSSWLREDLATIAPDLGRRVPPASLETPALNRMFGDGQRAPPSSAGPSDEEPKPRRKAGT